jgi:hypothetical protein
MDAEYFNPILFIPNLSKIILLLNKRSSEDPVANSRSGTLGDKEVIQEGVGKYLEYNKEVYKGPPPTVEVEGWSPVKP